MTFWQCYYHLVWTTKHRQPVITNDLKKIIRGTILDKSSEQKCHLLAMYIMPEHIHIAANIPPSIAIADYMQEIKGLSAYRINEIYPDMLEIFRWQKGYGVLTFGKK